jgi:hypothetical protein
VTESNNTDWRELCAAAAKEDDSKKLEFLLKELIRVLDEEKQAPCPLTLSEDQKTPQETLAL